MKKIIGVLTLLVTIVTFGQDNYTSGYYVDQNNKKIEGFIEDTNPYNNPEKINFKSSLEAPTSEISIANIKEFKITSNYKYVNYTVDYDYDQVVNRSEINIFGKEPNLKKKAILLKVLVEGNATLYKAIVDDCVFFYFKNNNDETPRLLIHRKYNDNKTISENNAFRKQLYDDIKTETLLIDDFLKLDFKESDLVKVFNKTNNASNSLVEQNVSADKGKNKFCYKIFGGVSTFFAPYTFLSEYKLKTSKTSFSNPIIGFEFSNILGTDSNRSELFGRLFYQKTNSESHSSAERNGSYPGSDVTLTSEFSAITISAGYRYAIIKSGKNKFSIDGGLGVSRILSGDFKLHKELYYFIGGTDPITTQTEDFVFDEYSMSIFLNAGLSYTFNNKYAVNLEYSTPKNYLSKYTDLSGGYSNFNLIFSYTLN